MMPILHSEVRIFIPFKKAATRVRHQSARSPRCTPAASIPLRVGVGQHPSSRVTKCPCDEHVGRTGSPWGDGGGQVQPGRRSAGGRCPSADLRAGLCARPSEARFLWSFFHLDGQCFGVNKAPITCPADPPLLPGLVRLRLSVLSCRTSVQTDFRSSERWLL